MHTLLNLAMGDFCCPCSTPFEFAWASLQFDLPVSEKKETCCPRAVCVFGDFVALSNIVFGMPRVGSGAVEPTAPSRLSSRLRLRCSGSQLQRRCP
jgi:hypothetical protein